MGVSDEGKGAIHRVAGRLADPPEASPVTDLNRRAEFARWLRLRLRGGGGTRKRAVGLALIASLAVACSTESSREQPVDPSQASESPDASTSGARDPWSVKLDPGAPTKTSLREHELGKAWVIDPELDEPLEIEIAQAEARGYTVIDLGDSWRPYIFTHKTPGVEDFNDNSYATRYSDLANDRTDHDGDPLGEHEHNYLELYGIPPSIGVVLDEWRALPEVEQCLSEAGYDDSHFDPSVGTIAYRKKRGTKRYKSWRWSKRKLEREMRKRKLGAEAEAGDYAAAAEHPKLERHYERFVEYDREVQIIRNAQIRFRCEKLFNDHDGEGKFRLGDFDGSTHHALANFEKKHDVMGWGHFTSENIAVLALSPREAIHARLERVLTERVISAAGVVEDGSAREWKPDFSYTDEAGERHELRDLAGELSEAAIAALALDAPETALARLEQLEQLAVEDPEHPEGFGQLLVAVKLPELPPYYQPNMQFSAVIDRGDVWYDFPWDEEGNKSGQPRRRYPHLTLYVSYRDQKIPLVHWRTTIGSWRSEEIDGKQYFAYKNSDVGDRVWQTIMAAPVWIPPTSTPSDTLVKVKYIDGKRRRVVNYDETGPGYMSAYGLVAAYHVKLNERSDGTIGVYDNQIRTHGSVDYMSILRRYSHGCHRLYNMNAVRMFSMILQHRDYVREGQTHVGAARKFEYKGKKYVMKLPTRGYKYTLTDPIPVTVTKGRIRGVRKSPHEDLMPKPGVDYSDEDEGEDGEDGEEPPPEPSEIAG